MSDDKKYKADLIDYWNRNATYFAAHEPSKMSGAVRYPDFFIIGAKKAATTWLSLQCSAHQQIFMPIAKELHYFSAVHTNSDLEWLFESLKNQVLSSMKFDHMRLYDEKYIKFAQNFYTERNAFNDDWYATNFSHSGVDQICGEASVSYSTISYHGLAHMKRLCPHAKIIFVARDRIERCWSHLRMIMKNSDPCAEEIQSKIEENSIILREYSNYNKILKRYRSTFGVENVFVGQYDLLKANPRDFLSDVFSFLNLEYDRNLFKNLDDIIFPGPDLEMPDFVHHSLSNILK